MVAFSRYWVEPLTKTNFTSSIACLRERRSKFSTTRPQPVWLSLQHDTFRRFDRIATNFIAHPVQYIIITITNRSSGELDKQNVSASLSAVEPLDPSVHDAIEREDGWLVRNYGYRNNTMKICSSSHNNSRRRRGIHVDIQHCRLREKREV